jgi:hypothetical protein
MSRRPMLCGIGGKKAKSRNGEEQTCEMCNTAYRVTYFFYEGKQ